MAAFAVDEFRIRSLSSSTVLSYRRAVGTFVSWLSDNRLDFTSVEQLDPLIAAFRAKTEPSRSGFITLVAALTFAWPVAKGRLPWATSLARAYDKLTEIKFTTPLTVPALNLLARNLINRNQWRVALGLVIQFRTGLRPSELLKLRRRDIVFTSEEERRLLQPVRETATLRLVKTKVGREQVATIFGDEDPELLKILHSWSKTGDSEAELIGLTYNKYRLEIAKACRAEGLSVTFTPHSARSGFATSRFIAGESPASIQLRGRWAHQENFVRYIDQGAAAAINSAIHFRGRAIPSFAGIADDLHGAAIRAVRSRVTRPQPHTAILQEESGDSD